MDAKEVGRALLAKTCEYLVSLPYDVKALQEAVSAPDLEKGARELAAGAVIYALHHSQEGSGHERFFDSVFLVRMAFAEVLAQGGDGAAVFRERFPDVYERIDEDLGCFETALGPELWAWLGGRLTSSVRLPHKGKRASEYTDDEEALDQLYEDCVDFQTNYSVTEAQLGNRLRRPEQIAEVLQRRHADSKKRP